MEFNKVIFLDIDGVIATNYEFNMTRNSSSYLHKYDIYPFNPKCVKILNEALALTKAKIVLSSDWRTFFSTLELQDIFTTNGVNAYLSAITPNLSAQNNGKSLADIRTLEIKSFLETCKVEKYVVVDDLNMSDGFEDKFVLCKNGLEGIKETGIINKIIVSLF